MDRQRWSRNDTAIAVIGGVLLVALIFPGYAVANRVHPILLGMPFGMFWIVLWVVIGAIALFVTYRKDSDKGDD